MSVCQENHWSRAAFPAAPNSQTSSIVKNTGKPHADSTISTSVRKIYISNTVSGGIRYDKGMPRLTRCVSCAWKKDDTLPSRKCITFYRLQKAVRTTKVILWAFVGHVTIKYISRWATDSDGDRYNLLSLFVFGRGISISTTFFYRNGADSRAKKSKIKGGIKPTGYLP